MGTHPDNINVDWYIERLKACNSDDIEADHGNADGILCELLTELGFEKVVEAWANVEKWYA